MYHNQNCFEIWLTKLEFIECNLSAPLILNLTKIVRNLMLYKNLGSDIIKRNNIINNQYKELYNAKHNVAAKLNGSSKCHTKHVLQNIIQITDSKSGNKSKTVKLLNRVCNRRNQFQNLLL